MCVCVFAWICFCCPFSTKNHMWVFAHCTWEIIVVPASVEYENKSSGWWLSEIEVLPPCVRTFAQKTLHRLCMIRVWPSTLSLSHPLSTSCALCSCRFRNVQAHMVGCNYLLFLASSFSKEEKLLRKRREMEKGRERERGLELEKIWGGEAPIV